MSEADVHVPEKRKRNAEANQDHLQNKDQINWKKKKDRKKHWFYILGLDILSNRCKSPCYNLSNLEMASTE